jgi:hypothetical protein
MRNFMPVVISLLALTFFSCGGDGVDGTYVPDEEALRAAVKEWLSQNPLPPGVSAEQIEKQIDEKFDAQMAQWSMELVLRPDGTFVLSVKTGAEEMDSKGTWNRDGSKLTMVTTHQNGKERPEPEEITAEFADGRITLSEKMEYPVVLERK